MGRSPWFATGLVAFSVILLLAPPAGAQLDAVTLDANYSPADGEKPNSSFTLPTQSADVTAALDEFQRMVKHEQWDQAFDALAIIAEKKTTGFIDRGDGVLVPCSLLVRGLLAELPSAGKSAYRLFYDSEAARLLERAVGKAEAENLSAIVANHLITSVGAGAADRLGDLRFERGDFEQAAAAWQAILTYCPESRIPKSQTLVKLATALARAGRWTEFGEVEQLISERYAGEEIEIGGRRVTAAEQVASLASSEESAGPSVGATFPDDFELPARNEPVWRFAFQSKDDPATKDNPFQLVDVYGRPKANDFVIPAAADDERLYVNVFGVEMAFDLDTGKLLWRSGKLHLLNLQQARQAAAPERYSINVYGNRVWSVGRDPQQANRQSPFLLTVRDAANGKEIFSSRRSLSSWSILGAPYLTEDPAVTWATSAGSIASNSTPRRATGAAPVLDFSQGFAASDRLSLNGKSAIVDSRLRLTDGGSKQASSVFATTPLSVGGFETQFDIQFKKAFADGMLFVLQGEGPKSQGKHGDGIGFEGISKSVGVKFDLYGPDANSTGLCLDGARPVPASAVSLTGSRISLRSSHVFRVNMSYDGADLQVTITDTKTRASHQQKYSVDIPDHVNGPTAYVGFAASCGNLTAVQDVLNWTYTPIAPRKKAPQVGDVAYVGAQRNQQGRELSLLVLNAADGKLRKTLSIGSYDVDQNQVYNDRLARPMITQDRDRLYVDTHAGAVAAINRQNLNIDWAMMYESPPPATGYNYNYVPSPCDASGPLVAGGLLFAKGMRSPRLLGIASEGPSAVWNRPVSTSAVLLAADDQRVYLGGEELTAYSLKTQELLWAVHLPLSADWSVPLVTKNRIYQFTSRGVCEVDKATGDIVSIFRGDDLESLGGSLFLTPGRLVTVSNVGITAYALDESPSESGNP